MKDFILIINSGSSSLKCTLFLQKDKTLERRIDINLKGIGSDASKLELISANEKEEIDPGPIAGVKEAFNTVFDLISKKKLTNISLVGHRFVHGGSEFSSSVVLDEKVIKKLETLNELAPLHNSACLEGIKESFNFFESDVKQVAVFDTAFYAALPAVASNYAIPADLKEKYKIKRYGFHGINHSFLWDWYKSHMEPKKSGSKIITLHLGSGCSITAILDGKPIDTSMGFTPEEGLIMATRAGDIDAGVIEFLCTHEKKSVTEVLHLLNFESGLLGVSQKSSKMQELLGEYRSDPKSQLAVEMFCYRALKYLGSYLAVLGEIDAILLSGGIGENSPEIRKRILDGLHWYGIDLDETCNLQAVNLDPGESHRISTPRSKVPIWVIGADENLSIARSATHIAS